MSNKKGLGSLFNIFKKPQTGCCDMQIEEVKNKRKNQCCDMEIIEVEKDQINASKEK